MAGEIVALAGGVGAARFLEGLAAVASPERLVVIGNTGDDLELHGLHISPDLDTVAYTLAGMALRRGLAELPDAIQQPIDVLWLYGRPGPLEQHLGGLAAYLAEHPANSEGWLILGYVRFGVGDPAGAIEALDRALALDPGDALCHLLRESASAVLDVRAGPVEGGDSASAAVAPIYWSAMSPQAPY